MDILVTGATGFIGSRTVRQFVGAHRVYVVARKPGVEQLLPGVIPIHADLAALPSLSRLPPRIDAVLHLAQSSSAVPADTRAVDQFRINADATLALARYAERAGASRFILASSGNVYAPSPEPRDEEAPIAPVDFYGVTKYVAERAVQEFATSYAAVILRLHAPYGPGQEDRMIPKIVRRVLHNEPVTLVNGGEPRVNPIHVDDLVRVIGSALEAERSCVLNVAGPEAVSVREIAEIAAQATGTTARFEHRESPLRRNILADTSRLSREFGSVVKITPQEGISELARCMKER